MDIIYNNINNNKKKLFLKKLVTHYCAIKNKLKKRKIIESPISSPKAVSRLPTSNKKVVTSSTSEIYAKKKIAVTKPDNKNILAKAAKQVDNNAEKQLQEAQTALDNDKNKNKQKMNVLDSNDIKEKESLSEVTDWNEEMEKDDEIRSFFSEGSNNKNNNGALAEFSFAAMRQSTKLNESVYDGSPPQTPLKNKEGNNNKIFMSLSPALLIENNNSEKKKMMA
jgi:hypothetical protein